MTKKILPALSKTVFAVAALSLCAILILNISTMVSLEKIKGGDSIQFGYACAIISSGSMEPAFFVNDLIVIKSSGAYQNGNIVTYVSDNDVLVTHRVIHATNSGYITQGDANNTPDREVQQKRVLGKVILVIPGIGLVLRELATPLGVAFIVAFSIGIIAILHLFRKMKEERKEGNE